MIGYTKNVTKSIMMVAGSTTLDVNPILKDVVSNNVSEAKTIVSELFSSTDFEKIDIKADNSIKVIQDLVKSYKAEVDKKEVHPKPDMSYYRMEDTDTTNTTITIESSDKSTATMSNIISSGITSLINVNNLQFKSLLTNEGRFTEVNAKFHMDISSQMEMIQKSTRSLLKLSIVESIDEAKSSTNMEDLVTSTLSINNFFKVIQTSYMNNAKKEVLLSSGQSTLGRLTEMLMNDGNIPEFIKKIIGIPSELSLKMFQYVSNSKMLEYKILNQLGISDLIKELLSIDSLASEVDTKSVLSKKAKVNFTAQDHNSLNTVMTGYLSKILTAFSGEAELVNDFETGTWNSKTEMKEKYDKKVRETVSSNSHIRDLFKDIFDDENDSSPDYHSHKDEIDKILYIAVMDPNFNLEDLLLSDSEIGRYMYERIVSSNTFTRRFKESLISAKADISRLNKSRKYSGSALNAFNDTELDIQYSKLDKVNIESDIVKLSGVRDIISKVNKINDSLKARILSIPRAEKTTPSESTVILNDADTARVEDTQSQPENPSEATSSSSKDMISDMVDKVVNSETFKGLRSDERIQNIENMVKGFGGNFKETIGNLFEGKNVDISDFGGNLASNVLEMGKKFTSSNSAGMFKKVLSMAANPKFIVPLVISGIAAGGLSKIFNGNKEEDFNTSEDKGDDRGFLLNAGLTVVGLGLFVAEGAGKAAGSISDVVKNGASRLMGTLFKDDIQSIDEQSEAETQDWEEIPEELNFEDKETEKMLDDLEVPDTSALEGNTSTASSSKLDAGGVTPMIEEDVSYLEAKTKIRDAIVPITNKITSFTDKIYNMLGFTKKGSVSSIEISSINRTIDSIAESQDTAEVDNSGKGYMGMGLLYDMSKRFQSMVGGSDVLKMFEKDPTGIAKDSFAFTPSGADITTDRPSFGFDNASPSTGLGQVINDFFKKTTKKVKITMILALTSTGGGGGMGGGGIVRSAGADGRTPMAFDMSKASGGTAVSTAGWSLAEVDAFPMNAEDPPYMTGPWIDDWLARYYPDSNMIGAGNIIMTLSNKYQISAGAALAVWAKETTFGISHPGTNDYNFGCIRWTEGSGYPPAFHGTANWNSYPNIQTGIEEWYKLVKFNYVDKGLVTYKQFLDVYSPTSDGNTHSLFKNLMWGVLKALGYILDGSVEPNSSSASPSSRDNDSAATSSGSSGDMSTVGRSPASPNGVNQPVTGRSSRKDDDVAYSGRTGVPVGVGGSKESDTVTEQQVALQLEYFKKNEGGRYTQGPTRDNWEPEPADADCSSMVYKSLIYAGIPCGYSRDTGTGWTGSLRDDANSNKYFNIIPDKSQIQPGDIILCLGWEHVVTYVGGGKIFHASHPGQPHLYANADHYLTPANLNMIMRPHGRGIVPDGGIGDTGTGGAMPSISLEQLNLLIEGERPDYLVRWDQDKADEIYNRVKDKYYKLFGYDSDGNVGPKAGSSEWFKNHPTYNEDGSMVDIIYTDPDGNIIGSDGRPISKKAIVHIHNNHSYVVLNEFIDFPKDGVGSVTSSNLDDILDISVTKLDILDKIRREAKNIQGNTVRSLGKMTNILGKFKDRNILLEKNNKEEIITEDMLNNVRVQIINVLNDMGSINTESPNTSVGGGGDGVIGEIGNPIAGAVSDFFDFELSDDELIKMILMGG